MKMISRRSGKKKGGRLLITVDVMGSAGPIRFLVNEGDLISTVVATAIRNYSKQRRLPVLGSRIEDFLLYSPEYDVLSFQETIGKNGDRRFLLCKKQQLSSFSPPLVDDKPKKTSTHPKVTHGAGNWKTWINKALTFKIASF